MSLCQSQFGLGQDQLESGCLRICLALDKFGLSQGQAFLKPVLGLGCASFRLRDTLSLGFCQGQRRFALVFFRLSQIHLGLGLFRLGFHLRQGRFRCRHLLLCLDRRFLLGLLRSINPLGRVLIHHNALIPQIKTFLDRTNKLIGLEVWPK